ncbi:MAG TPA: NAD(P)-binding protein [Anaerovoracaceae bacterium]|nr:NAD(P)-binding protein [Anaerovoracaceae bacterium]
MEKKANKINDCCLQDEPAFCTVACPFHMDTVDFIEKMQRGSFNAAFKTYRNAVGFPEIVAVLCREPCKTVCPRKDTDEAIALNLLEKASIRYAKNIDPIEFNVPKKNKKIAVVGAGISGLACALRLASKKYEVSVYERSGRIGGHLWDVLPSDFFLRDIERQFQYEKYTLNLNTDIGSLDRLEYDAVYVATGAGGDDFGLLGERHENSFATKKKGVFSGGFLLGVSSVEAIAHGLNAANQIENYLKTGNISRAEEMTGTKLKLDPRNLTYRKPVHASDGSFFSEKEAIEEAARCLSCSCNACHIYCDLIQYFRKKPKPINEEVRATTGLEGVRGDIKVATKLIATCNQCGLCGITCPQKIDMGELLLEGRRALHRKGSLPWAYHDFFLRDMTAANHESAALTAAPRGYSRSGYAFFPGCQLGASDPRYVVKSYRYLLDRKPDTALMLSCCGAPAVWAGDESLQDEAFQKIKENWSSLGKPIMVFACTTCRKMFREYLPEIEGVFLYETLLQGPGRPSAKLDGRIYSVFDPCTSHGETALHLAVRELAERAGGILQPLPFEKDHAQCCSFGGQPAVANPDYIKKVIIKRIAQSDYPFITYCANCRDIFSSEGKPVLHILDVMFDINDERRRPPTISERRNNRIELKRGILKKFRDEEPPAEKTGSGITLQIGEALRKKLNDELILEQDVTSAVEYCEETCNKVIGAESGHFFGYKQIGRFTCWVEYRPVQEGFELINAYCHRMNIVGREPQNESG